MSSYSTVYSFLFLFRYIFFSCHFLLFKCSLHSIHTSIFLFICCSTVLFLFTVNYLFVYFLYNCFFFVSILHLVFSCLSPQQHSQVEHISGIDHCYPLRPLLAVPDGPSDAQLTYFHFLLLLSQYCPEPLGGSLGVWEAGGRRSKAGATCRGWAGHEEAGGWGSEGRQRGYSSAFTMV